jgi:hypothetical protein
MVDFDDWPLDNVRSTRFVMKEMRKSGRTWLTASQDWATKSGVRATDRAVHEHRALSKALSLFEGYDQYNMLNSAGVEVLVKRRMLIESAYHNRPDAPDFTSAAHLLGFKAEASGEFIDPSAIKHAATRMKAETDVLKELRLKKEETMAARRPPKGGGEGGGGK